MKTHLLVTCSVMCAGILHAQDTTKARRDSIARLGGVRITADRDTKPILTQLTLPVTASVTAQKVQETVNIIDTEDAVKYLPSVFLRKRNNGDTQAVMATRVWGVSSSARSLIYADGVPITALIANNNNIGGPRWGLVAPEEIERIDMMYGPFSAAYAGNSMGAVMEITTRMPEHFETSLNYSHALQSFNLYDTKQSYATKQAAFHLGNRKDKLAFWASANFQDSHSQPLSYVTATTFPTGTSGGIAETNKLGVAANVLGASGLLHTKMTNARIKVTYDLSPTIRAAYTLGFWQNLANATTDSYLTASGQPTFSGVSGFASGNYHLVQQHSSHNLSIRSNTNGNWDFEAVGTLYHYDKDKQQTPTTASATGMSFGTAGRVAILDGTGWMTADLKGAWHQGGLAAAHLLTFGTHADRYTLFNPTYNTANWITVPSYTSTATEGDGKTSTQAVWAQESWRLAPDVKLTVGGRYEWAHAFEGHNINGATAVHQPEVNFARFSPKASLAWNATSRLSLTASAGKAYRFATASELYQLVTTGTTFTSPNPDLKPDNVLATELRAVQTFNRAQLQLSLFNDDVHDAIISQFQPLVAGSSTLYSFASNVDHVRARGVEAVVNTRNLLINGLELSGSVTYLDAKTLALSGSPSATTTPAAAIGKRLPNIPEWRGNMVVTYRPTTPLAITVGARYSSLLYTTLDNADTHPNTYQGFSEWFVMDAHANYRYNSHWSASLGADNLLDRKYFLFHPFPHRTLVTSIKYAL